MFPSATTWPDLRFQLTRSARSRSPSRNIRTSPVAVTTSASGLDPHISPAYAGLQAARVAQARGVSVEQVQAVIDQNTDGALLGFIGQPRVNVLLTNRALDARFPATPGG